MSDQSRPFNVTDELNKLRHEKKNGQMRALPPNATIQKRPIIHAPIPSQHAGAKVPKVVYVSSKTPFISAVKRVKKLLTHVEKRATKDVQLIRNGPEKGMRKLAQASEDVGKQREEVLVKASGRAMEKALRIGEWFKEKEKDVLCNVEVRSGSVSVVDDIVETKEESEESASEEEHEEQIEEFTELTTELEGGETTLELLGNPTSTSDAAVPVTETEEAKESTGVSTGTNAGKKKRKRGKRKRKVYEADELPESRIRWVKTVEVAISLKG
ncbi:uncharacterized protein AB675_10056 [Cyphellophora attinorum]|uniref:Uncharacterized protein n=1 Tax=Cyphellophora attinorum TaxID=1664694 RepID=A0A0N1H610_9EURO|nr:uncharacterized protein AB675_10056 [Phialophora attinorum]KPI36633.1 hypothetical protein AB675_10056 [Phialophora attinorum]